jgi:hypothetical protein
MLPFVLQSCRCVMKPSDLRNLPPRNKREQGPNSWCSFIFAFTSPLSGNWALLLTSRVKPILLGSEPKPLIEPPRGVYVSFALRFAHLLEQDPKKLWKNPGRAISVIFGHVLAKRAGCTIITPQIFGSPRTVGDYWCRRFNFCLLQIYLLMHHGQANRSRAVLGVILRKNGTKVVFKSFGIYESG